LNHQQIAALLALVTCRKASRAGTSQRRADVTGLLRIFPIAGRMKPRREQRQRLGGEALPRLKPKRTIVSGSWNARWGGRRWSRRKAIRKTSQENIGDNLGLNKAAVWGVLDRQQRKVRATVVPNVNREVLQKEILSNIAHDSRIYTDRQWSGYDGKACGQRELSLCS
jgi:hypothetical protein